MSRDTVIVLLYPKTPKKRCMTARKMMVLFRPPQHELDPLDLEILERAFDATWAAVKGTDRPVEFDSDEGLEAILRRELIEIAYLNGVSDPETLRDMLERLNPRPLLVGQIRRVALGLLLNFGHAATRRWGPHHKLESRPKLPFNGFSNGL